MSAPGPGRGFSPTPAYNRGVKHKNIAILISGRGSNMEAILKAHKAEQWPCKIVAVISSRPNAAGLDAARAAGIPTQVIDHKQFAGREAFDAMLKKTLEALRADYVILAGFMRVLSEGFVNSFRGRLVNIHPSLLPAFPGLATHRQALAAGVRVHGCTVHFVTPAVDGGPIIAQAIVPVMADDTEDSLADRVLAQEHKLLPAVVRALVEDRIAIEGRQVVVSGMPTLVVGS
ncbi:phosphoribosylglycinamide formyltransferase [beta proteobacterium AAP99]|nr:phosphoribosylglycinamide formyltransferase [beta proteobacterium AAP99]